MSGAAAEKKAREERAPGPPEGNRGHQPWYLGGVWGREGGGAVGQCVGENIVFVCLCAIIY
jgi:hypothetical protein